MLRKTVIPEADMNGIVQSWIVEFRGGGQSPLKEEPEVHLHKCQIKIQRHITAFYELAVTFPALDR